MPTRDPRVIVRNDTGANRYLLVLADPETGEERRAGYAAYDAHGSTVVFTHTEVEEGEQGHGIGSFLVQSALDDVRAHGLMAVPQCPFVAQFVREHASYLDVVDPDSRAAVAAGG